MPSSTSLDADSLTSQRLAQVDLLAMKEDAAATRLVVGTPQVVRLQTIRQRCAFGSRTWPGHAVHQPVTIQHSMHSAGSRHFDGVRQSSQQALANLAGSPVR